MIQYIVQPGDTLYSISLKFRTTVSDLMEINPISGTEGIHPGQILNIPLPARNSGRLSAALPPPCQSVRVLSGLLLLLSADKPVYQPGDTVSLSLWIANLTNQTIPLDYNTSQRYDFQLDFPSGQTLWQWSDDKSFAQIISSFPFSPDQSIRFEEQFALPLSFPSKIDSLHVLGWNTSRQASQVKLHLTIRITGS